jgi:hypothetical protein
VIAAGVLALAAKAIAAVGIGLAGGRRLRPALALLAGGVVADAAREVLGALVLRPARAALGSGVPYAGWTRAAFHADQALFLAWPFGVLALSLWAWRRRWMPALDAWIASCLLFFYAYPSLRSDPLGRAYALVAAGCALWGLLAVALRTERAGRVQLVALLLLAGECATLAGPYVARPFESWPIAQVTWTIAFAGITLAAWWGRWTRRA